MSQPCSAPAAVLFDAAGLQVPEAHPAVVLAKSRGALVGAISNRPDVGQLVEAAGHTDLFEIWVAGTDGEWPFERALGLLSVEPQRAIFVSEDPHALREAEAIGLQILTGGFDQLEQALP